MTCCRTLKYSHPPQKACFEDRNDHLNASDHGTTAVPHDGHECIADKASMVDDQTVPHKTIKHRRQVASEYCAGVASNTVPTSTRLELTNNDAAAYAVCLLKTQAWTSTQATSADSRDKMPAELRSNHDASGTKHNL